jgi:RhtB (resistance to homoserine/threonine) family protein
METPQFIAIATVHFFAMATPGPDFAMVVRQSIVHGRATAVWTSIGLGAGILVHVTYSLLGIGFIVSQSIFVFTLMKFAGAAYLIFIGIQSLRARPREALQDGASAPETAARAGAAIRVGFFTNALNPKVTLFFLMLFTAVIHHTTPVYLQALYGVYMAVVTVVWYSMLSLLLGQGGVRAVFQRFGHWVERVTGAVLVVFGVRLAFTSAQG